MYVINGSILGDLDADSRDRAKISRAKSRLTKFERRLAGFSFEAGGRTFRPVVCHSTSGTLRSILAIFFLLLYYIFFLLRRLMNILTRG